MSFTFDLGAFSAALILAVAGAFAYWNQRRVDRQHELKMRRRELYSAFVTSLVDAANGNPEPHLLARIEATVVASDRVLKALAEYNDYAERTSPVGGSPRDNEKFSWLLAAVVFSMREDVFEKSTVPLNEYPKLIPIRV